MATKEGTSGDDQLVGTIGNDTLSGDAGDDKLFGKAGNDTLKGDAGADYLDGGTGNDKLVGGKHNDTLWGDNGDDKLYGSAGDDGLAGEAGDDVLDGGKGADQLQGGTGNDTYYVDNINDVIYDNDGGEADSNDTVYVSVDGYDVPDDIENVIFTAGFQAAPYFIDSLNVGWHWGNLREKQTLSYSFATEASGGESGFEVYSDEQQQNVALALEKYSAISLLSFVEVADDQEADLRFFRDDLTSAGEGETVAGYAESPQSEDGVSEIHIRSSYNDFSPSTYGFELLLHEIGHALGFKHPFDNTPVLPEDEDNTANTVMSYEQNSDEHQDLQFFDKAILHYLYGVNPSERADNDIYNIADKYIWDGAGKDTLSAADETQSVYLDLNAGHRSYVEAETESILDSGQAFIGYESVIENAIAGSGDDTLIGNHKRNILRGGDGKDDLRGQAGNDKLIGGNGNDKLYGGLGKDNLQGQAGNDTYVIDSKGDKVVEKTNKGNDSVESSIHYTLPDNVENLILSGTKNLKGKGNNAANDLSGNDGDNVLYGYNKKDTLDGGLGDDTLIGGKGNDVLTGGEGVDSFRFDTLKGFDTITDYNPQEDKLEVSGDLFPTLQFSYNSSEGSLWYDDENADTSLQLIGMIGTGFDASDIEFVII